MRTIGLLVLVACGCGGGYPKTCSELFGQDCGPTLTVTMKYSSTSGPCAVAHDMPTAQYEYAVKPAYVSNCSGGNPRFAEPTATTRTVDCSIGTPPPGCATATCAWQPPLLAP